MALSASHSRLDSRRVPVDQHSATNRSLSELERALFASLEQLRVPTSVMDLRRALPRPLQASADELRQVLDALVERGQLFAVGARRSRQYSTSDPEQRVADGILALLRERPRSKAELNTWAKREAPWVAELEPLLQQLVDAGRIFGHPQLREGLPTKSIAKYGLEPAAAPAPERFLPATIHELEKAARQAAAHGISMRTLFDELRRRFEREIGAAPAVPQPSASASDLQRTLAALRDLQAQDPGAALIPVRKLREQLALDKSRFDGAVLALSQKGVVILHHHDFPSSLPEVEREKLVMDAQGTYYVGIALGAV